MKFLLLSLVILLSAVCAQELDLVGSPEEDLGNQLSLHSYVADNGQVLLVGFIDETSLQDLNLLQGYEYDTTESQLYGYTDALTSKIGDMWKFDLSLEGKFDDYYVGVYLPSGAEITKIDTGVSYRIGQDDGNLLVEFDDLSVQDPDIRINYKLGAGDISGGQTATPLYRGGARQTGFDLLPFIAIIAVVIIIIIIIVLVFAARSKKRTQHHSVPSLHVTGEMERLMRTLNENERAVLNVIVKHDGKATQNRVRQETNIPKSSLSGIVANLETKGILKRFKHGNTNDLELSSWFLGKKERS